MSNTVTEKSKVVIKTDLLKVLVSNIEVEEDFNTRTEFAIDDILPSIIENGVLNPIVCYKKRGEEVYVLIDGERRFRAVKKAIEKGHEILRIPVILREKMTKEERTFEICIRNNGKSLTPIELGETYKKLKAFGYEPKEIAKKIGKSLVHVYQMIKIAEMPKEVKTQIAENNVSASQVLKINKNLKNGDDIADVITSTVNKRVSQPSCSIGKTKKSKKITISDVGSDKLKQTKKEANTITIETLDDIIYEINLITDCKFEGQITAIKNAKLNLQ